MSAPTLHVTIDRFPVAGSFTISRGSRTESVVVTATLDDGRVKGWGECVPYARYGEQPEGVAELISSMTSLVEQGMTRREMQAHMPAGAARNALDAAFWDYESKQAGRRVWDLAGLPAPGPAVTAYTLSLGTPDSMAEAAGKAADRPLLKVKLGGAGDDARIAAVRRAAPGATLIADANEAWTPDVFAVNLAACEAAGVTLIEQPLPAGQDAFLESVSSSIAFCADESFHGLDSLAVVKNRYQAVNIKLDKTGGLTEALRVAEAARESGLAIMVGCMLGTSLAMAPAFLLAAQARFVDLDGPLLLAKDRDPGIAYDGSIMNPFPAALWG